jgi:ligand-binding SRPBCC domain-containing protein
MAEFRHEITVAAPLERVWGRFQDVLAFLPALSPPGEELKILSAAPLPPRVGTRIEMTLRGPLGRVAWVAEYVELVPPHATITGAEARFVDVQVRGPFRSWVHSHEFEAVDDHTTRCVDCIVYTPPLGPLGWVGDVLVVRPAVRKMFAYRAAKLREAFE